VNLPIGLTLTRIVAVPLLIVFLISSSRVHALIARHAELTGSRKAAEIMSDADVSLRHVWRVAPKSDVAKISQKQEGTLKGARA